MTTPNYTFIINPCSGTQKNKEYLERFVRKKMEEAGAEYEIAYTSEPGHATRIASEAIGRGVEMIVAVGGDGTVNEVGRALIRSNAVLGIIPIGSGNGLARHFGIPVKPLKALDVLLKGNIQSIDAAAINDNVFLSVAGVGYDARVAKKFSMTQRRGFFTYFRIAFSEYFTYKPRKITLVLDGKTITRKAMMVTFANSNQFGNNASIDPEAKIDDGLIDVCIVRKIPYMLLPFYIPRLFTRSFHKTHFIEIIPARDIVVTSKEGNSVNLDGDPFKIGEELHVQVLPLSLKIIVP